MFLPETDRLRLIASHRRLDRRKSLLIVVLLSAFVLPSAVAFAFAAMRPDPESTAWFWAGVVWAGVGVVLVVRDVRRRRWAIHDETPGLKLRARPRGMRDRLAGAVGGLALIGFGLLLWHFALGALGAMDHEPGKPYGTYLRVRVISCEQTSVIPGMWWECQVGSEIGRRVVEGQFTPSDVDVPVPVLYDPALGFSRLDVPEYGVFSGPATGVLQVLAVGVIGWGIVRTARRPFMSRDETPVPGLLLFKPAEGAHALPELVDGVPVGAFAFSVFNTADDGRQRLGIPTVAAVSLAVYFSVAVVFALVGVWALRSGGRPWAAVVLGFGVIMPSLFGLLFRLGAMRCDGSVAYSLYGRFLYLRGDFGVVTADLHDPRVQVVADSRTAVPTALSLALPGRHVPHLFAIVENDNRRPDEELLMLAAVLDRSPFAKGRRSAARLVTRTSHSIEADLPTVPGLDTESTPLPTAHLRRRPFLAGFFVVLQVAVAAFGLVTADGSEFGTAWLLCLVAALLCGPLGYAARVSLTWGAPAKRRTAGAPLGTGRP